MIDYSYIKNTSRQVVRRIEIMQEDKTDLTFDQRYYFDVNQTVLWRLNIYAFGDELQQALFKVDKVYCTLHNRRKGYKRQCER